MIDYLNKNKEFQKDRDCMIEKLIKNPIIEIFMNINSFDEKLHFFLQECIFRFVKLMNEEIDTQINKNETLVQMNNLLLLEIYSNFKNIDFISNDFQTFLCFSESQKEMDVKLSLNQNIRNANEQYVSLFLLNCYFLKEFNLLIFLII